MDEETLEAAIAAYGAQMQQVEEALLADLDPAQQSDLVKLKEDLCQLIELTEASLVSVKKSLLLASLEDSNDLQANTSEAAADSNTANGSLDADFAAFYSELGESSGSSTDTREGNQEGKEEEEDDLSGTKVRAPYRTTWGTLEYHNAMVVGAEPPDGEEEKVRVLYVYPTQKSMKPCPFYLEDKCRFQENCRFSHGEVVYVSELREFMEFDLSNLEEGSSCLARHEDGIWYPAKIKEIDSGFYTVKFDSLMLKHAVVEADCIIPPLREDDPLTSDLEDALKGDDIAFVGAVMDSAEQSSAMLNNSCFGGWEAHTRGIGSKLMLKMGYEYGKGLGKMQEGRVEPIMAVVLPKHKSLDHCIMSTQRSLQGKAAKCDPLTRRQKKKRKFQVAKGRHTVFDFLNHKLGNKRADPAEEGAAAPSALTEVEAYRGGKSTKRNLNVELFQASAKVSQTEKKIQKLNESLRKKRGRSVLSLIRLNFYFHKKHQLLAKQKAQELSIQREHKKDNTHKKMTEF
ncbi:Zinc finger CCCH-type with G patch domain-containing protein [Channa argus]|uniref:Zinc finger CCCH-type with G patch domain-containing protein n=1 Tax=Channa argus TaxID=215402 RepID=A0A6G1Q2T1_CHAAH|nr:Zinc finger CCCH-type with G patch domain-containing protein [Channa argus]